MENEKPGSEADRLADVLQKHFKCIAPQIVEAAALDEDPKKRVKLRNGVKRREALKYARQLLIASSAAGAFQAVERADKDPLKDLENLKKAAKSLSAAHASLARVGWYGQSTFSMILQPIVDEETHQFLEDSGSRYYAAKELLSKIEQLSARLKKAAGAVDVDGKSVMSTIDSEHRPSDRPKTKPTKTQARFFAAECAKVFFELTGNKPTVATRIRELGSAAYGPFFDFVTDAFKAVGIKASAERFARLASKDFSLQNER